MHGVSVKRPREPGDSEGRLFPEAFVTPGEELALRERIRSLEWQGGEARRYFFFLPLPLPFPFPPPISRAADDDAPTSVSHDGAQTPSHST